MRRPLFAFFLCFACGIALEHLFRCRKAGLWLLLPAAAALLFCLLRKKQFWPYALAFLLGAGCLWADGSLPRALDGSVGETVRCRALVLEAELQGESLRLLVLGPEKLLVRLPAGAQRAEDLCGRAVVLQGTVALPEGPRNPGAFDYPLYLQGRGVRHVLTAESCESGPVRLPLHRAAALLKARFRASLAPLLHPDSLALLCAMLFGEREALSDAQYAAVQSGGLSHLTAVSGLHVGMLYALLQALLRRQDPRLRALLSLSVLFFYGFLAAFSPSVVRALVMVSLHACARLRHKAYDLLSCSAAAALLILFLHPARLFSAGFQLSFLAVFSLAFVLPLLKQKAAFLGSFFAIQLSLLPAVAYLFNYVSVASFFLNPPGVFLAALLVPLGLLLLALSLLCGALLPPCAAAADFLCRSLALLIEAGGALFGARACCSPPLPFLLFWLLFLFFVSSETFWDWLRKRALRRIAGVLLCGALFSALFTPGLFLPDGRAAAVFLDVGQGDCLHVRTPGGRNLLIDGGGREGRDLGTEVLKPYLLKNGVKQIDLAIVTHLHTDHYKGIAELSQSFPVRQLALYSGYRSMEDEVLRQFSLPKEGLLYLQRGERIRVEEGVFLEILHPPAGAKAIDPEDENSCSLLLRVTVDDLRLLMTADLGTEGEETVLRHYGDAAAEALACDVLKVAHHGSKYSSSEAFLDAAAPRLAVIQVGRNLYGHPAPETIEKLQKKDIMIYSNLERGAVLIDRTAKGIRVRSML